MPSAHTGAESGTGAGDPALRLYHALNLAQGAVWLLGLVQLLSPVRIPLAERGVPLGMLAAFFVLPGALPFLWLAERRRTVPRSRARRSYCIASRLFLGLSWLPTWTPVLFVIAIWQPWPLSLREGPDTDFAREGYARLFGGPPPAAVRGVHYRVDGPRDPIFFLRCEGVERASLDAVVQRLGLEPAETVAARAPLVGERVPDWWPRDLSGFDATFQRNQGWTAIWYRERDGLLLYREVTF